MTATFNTSSPLPSCDDVALLEKMVGGRLPEGYRNFLLAQNGGKPTEGNFNFNNSDVYTDSVLRSIFSLEKISYKGLRHKFEIYTQANRMPSNMLPIGDDFAGNIICISTSGKDVGKIYFWDHENETSDDDEADYSNLYEIANTFEEFIILLGAN